MFHYSKAQPIGTLLELPSPQTSAEQDSIPGWRGRSDRGGEAEDSYRPAEQQTVGLPPEIWEISEVGHLKHGPQVFALQHPSLRLRSCMEFNLAYFSIISNLI